MVEALQVRASGERILECMAGGLESAAKAYAGFIADGGTDADLLQEFPQVGVKLWQTLRAVADGKVSPRLISAASGAVSPAMIMLPLAEQEKIVVEGADLLTAAGEALKVRLSVMSPMQRRQVFAVDHVRSLPEQRAWIEDQQSRAAAKKPKEANAQFEIDSKKNILRVKMPCDLTRADLLRILAKMEG